MEFGETGEGTDVGCSADGTGSTRSPGCDDAVSTLIEDTALPGQSARLYARPPARKWYMSGKAYPHLPGPIGLGTIFQGDNRE
jgi:hypothetical protein